MSAPYQILLDATIEHLQALQGKGVRHVTVQPDILRALTAPLPRSAMRFGAPSEAAPQPTQSSRGSSENKTAPKLQIGEAFLTSPMDRAAKEAAMAQLRERVMPCQKCPDLAKARTQVVFGVGDIHSELMFVGEAPGADEDAQGEPFVGKAGQLLTKIIQTMGYSRETVYIANILKCRPDTPGQLAGNRKPTPEEMNTCLPYLLEQIEIIRPKVIVALGATAMEGLFGKSLGIMKLRGHWQEFRGIPVMPTFHPAYLLRNQAMSEKRKVWEDMRPA